MSRLRARFEIRDELTIANRSLTDSILMSLHSAVAKQDWRSAARKALRVTSRPLHPFLSSIWQVQTDRAVAALTFDDGPDAYHTPRILESLARHDARATFFVLTQRAERFPHILAAILDAGHEIGLHGDDHSPVIGCSTRAKVRKIRTAKRRLESLLTQQVNLFRPPYGWQDVRAFLVARSAGLRVVAWSAEGEDWLDLSPAEVADRATKGFVPGSIVLLHDRTEPLPHRHDELAKDLDRAAVVEELFQRPVVQEERFVPVGELLDAGVALRRPWFWRPVDLDLALGAGDQMLPPSPEGL
jgi:peptidoglycan/xylan/chitin deacetylase (PgdA/CDA1 family)